MTVCHMYEALREMTGSTRFVCLFVTSGCAVNNLATLLFSLVSFIRAIFN